MKRNTLYFTLIIVLGSVIILTLIVSAIILCFCDNCSTIPSGIIAIGSTAVGGLAGLLVNSSLPNDPVIKTTDDLFKEADELNEKAWETIKQKENDEAAEKLRQLRIKKLRRILGDDFEGDNSK